MRWSAPEVLFGTTPASKQADIFSFGMVVVEVCSSFVNIMIRRVRCSTFVNVVGIHGERSLPRRDFHRGYLQSDDRRAPSSATRGRNIRSVGCSVEDDRVLLAAPSQKAFESVRSGRPSTGDVRFTLTNVFRKGSARAPRPQMTPSANTIRSSPRPMHGPIVECVPYGKARESAA